MILLDTCVLLWLASDPSRISPVAAQALIQSRGTRFVSAISAYEVGQKNASSKLTLPMPVEQWFPAMLLHHGLEEISVTGAIAAAATRLPPIHRDPFDRLLIATAIHHRLSLLTPDPLIRQYAGVITLW